MAPRPSPARSLDRLIDDLGATDPVTRDTAIARLRVMGPRAVPRLAALVRSDAAAARVPALTALEGIEDPRAADVAVGALDTGDDDATVAALGVLRGWVPNETGTRLLEAITAIAVDRAREPRVRVAAMDALSDLPDELTRPIREQTPPPESAGPPLDDPLAAHEWVLAHGPAVTLARLHDVVRTVRERESADPGARRRQAWARVRGAAHRALAARGSRVALYDLRESFDTARAPLPDEFIEAVAGIGDASCLEPLARAWAAAPDEATWRGRLRDAAGRIRHRAGLNGRNAVVRRIRSRWDGFL